MYGSVFLFEGPQDHVRSATSWLADTGIWQIVLCRVWHPANVDVRRVIVLENDIISQKPEID